MPIEIYFYFFCEVFEHKNNYKTLRIVFVIFSDSKFRKKIQLGGLIDIYVINTCIIHIHHNIVELREFGSTYLFSLIFCKIRTRIKSGKNIMDSTNNQKGGEMLGVSRSGRIRKKSSKLMDFQNPDEIDTKPKKNRKVTLQSVATDESESVSASEDDSDDIEQGVEAEEGELDESLVDPTVRKSLYMQEKFNKKKVLKDGKVVYGKSTRKDKGKTRITAYMLWCRENRSNMKQTDSDQTRRLAEMWANVPTQEKIIWRRKAKRLANKNKKQDAKLNQGNINKSNSTCLLFRTSSYINRSPYAPTGNPVGRPPKRVQQIPNNKPQDHFGNSSAKEISKRELEEKELQDTLEETAFSIFQTSPVKNAPQIQPGVYKVTGLEPLDVAAHLNLLGESLSIIGERLKEHEGQITVSGSLSVLLDSLLCSLGPLMCLTCSIPNVGTDTDKKLRDNMHKTLDNIAYIMPGL
ncbi:uncharacterized protein LOC129605922 isoform X2 [Condylostylus longicornis]|uniref:uncharacterized protein LOC129605922 isoform X2 n=1 Tax=Condylostylus longicornis TaxID=2530218 RepID=UPI00244E4A5F|nr:uncharacterized protein LOC129605922 isoform X2 [Condylostylus longicornis]